MNRHHEADFERDFEREWQAQERARLQERDGTPLGADPRAAPYRRIARVLREPLPDGLPMDFAQKMAQRMAPQTVDAPLERRVLSVLIALLGIAGGVVVAYFGADWLAAFAPLWRSAAGAVPWVLTGLLCLGGSWAVELWLQHRHPTA